MNIKAANSNFILDIPANQMTFLDSRFYSQDGEFFPSVTTYLEAYPKSAQFYEWLKKMGEDADTVRDEAGARGSNVHRLTEDYDNGLEVSLLDENGYIGYKLSEWNMFEKYVEFRTNIDAVILHNELNLVSAKYKMGGTVDRVMQINGQTLVVDIKTANSLHPHYWLQLAAYQKMLEEKEIHTDGVAILWLGAKTRTAGKGDAIQGKGWQMVICKDAAEIATYWKRFEACQMLWTAENGDSKPRQLTYSLTHKYSKTA